MRDMGELVFYICTGEGSTHFYMVTRRGNGVEGFHTSENIYCIIFSIPSLTHSKKHHSFCLTKEPLCS